MVQVKVSEGVLEGEVVQNEYGGSFNSFKGIPYAEPPLGNLRFKAPQPPKPWEGIRSAKSCGPQCIQVDVIVNSEMMGSEDCLYLNVYTPDIKPSKPLPVMFWVHGGGFLSGSGHDDIYGPEFLVRQDVVLVTINYRLEVLGFLSLDTEDVPGNAGMKDQVQALRWVNQNIVKFGGDPDNVTIFGESAGGASVSYLLLSPMTKGLFRRAIAQSGAATCDWSQAYNPRERGFALGRHLGLYTEDVQELYDFLMNQPVESLVKARVPILLSERASEDIDLYFSVVDEKPFGNQERFFYGSVLENIRRGTHAGVDVMTGYTTEEGIINLGTPDHFERKINMANNYLEYFVPKPLTTALPADLQLEIGKKMKCFYFSTPNVSAKDWEQLVRFYSATMFVYGTIQFVKNWIRNKSNKLFFYKFSCKSERNMMTYLLGAGSIIGTTPVTAHGDDVMYLFNAKMAPKVVQDSDAFKHIERVTKLWTNFAKFGNPTPDSSFGVQWLPYTLENQEYLNIGNDLVTETKPDTEEIQFWENLYKEHAPKLAY